MSATHGASGGDFSSDDSLPTLAPPFAGVFETGDPVIMKDAVVRDAPEGIEGMPSTVNSALLRALAKDPKARFGSCEEFVGHCFGQRPQGGGGLQTAVSAQGGGGTVLLEGSPRRTPPRRPKSCAARSRWRGR